MAHWHYCETCKQPTAVCDGPCQQDAKHYCTMHHPDPQFHKDWRPYQTHPVVRAVEDKEFTIVPNEKKG